MSLALTLPKSFRLSWRPSSGNLLIGLFTLAIGFLVVYPLVMLLLGSFAPPRGVTNVAFSLDGYRTALFDADARRAIVTTLWLSLVRATLAVALATFLAWSITRTNLPGRRLFHNLLILGFFLPLLPQIVAWSLLLSPKTGLINVAIRNILGLQTGEGPFSIFSYGGIIFLGTLGWAGFLYLILSPAFQAMDASLEEAGRIAGAPGWRTVLKITVPLLMPALLGAFGLAFVRMVESFETELFLGTPANIYVFTTQIFYYISGTQLPDYPPAIALSTILIVLTAAIIVLQNRLLAGRSYVTVTGKAYRQTRVDLRGWKWLILAVFILFFVTHLVLPLAMLVFGSVQRSTNLLRFNAFTLDHWKVLANPDVWQSLRNTLFVGLVAATVGALVTSLASYIVMKSNLAIRHTLDVFTWVPYMMPSFVLGLGFLWAVLKGIPLPFTLYGTLTLLMIVFVVRNIPVGARIMNGTMVQLGSEIEDAARVSGASWPGMFRRIILPLLRPSLTVAWLIFMITVVRDLSTVVLLYGPKSKMLAVVFYGYWTSGAIENAAVIGLFMAAVGLLLAGGIRLLGSSPMAMGEAG